MDREGILREIRRTTKENEGRPLGYRTFEKATGISLHQWSRYWPRWGDALHDAGFAPNEPPASYTDAFVVEHLVGLTRKLGHYPTWREWGIERRSNAAFPSVDTARRMGGVEAVAAKVLEYCRSRDDCADVLSLIPLARSSRGDSGSAPARGYVYLIKAGRMYKIGKATNVDQRSRQFSIQLPHPHVVVHKIETDDALGIEAYWHRRFADKRQGTSEWFALTADDVKAFKRRQKFM